MARAPLLGLLTALCFATVTMGLPLTGEDGKLSVSNIPPALFVSAALVLFLAQRQPLSRNVIRFFVAFNAAAMASFVIFQIRFGWEPNLVVLLFQNVQILFCLLLIWYARGHYEEFRRAVRAGIYCSALVIAYYGWSDLSAGEFISAFGMDDHSHAAVILTVEAYILLRYFGGATDLLLGLGLLVLSFLTLSRLPVFFLPAIFLVLLRRSPITAGVAAIGICVMAYFLLVAGDSIAQIFRVLNRVSSVEAISGEGSTTAHLYLLRSALQMKFSDLWTFVFGIGPGNFSKAITSLSPPAITQLEAVDPTLLIAARAGRAPLHSVPMQVLLDYNLALCLFFTYGVFRAADYLLRARSLIDVMFFFGLLGASTFYSLHNKPYFYLFVVTIAVFVTSEATTARAGPGRRHTPRASAAETPAYDPGISGSPGRTS
jgi:hypothetical protein